MTKEELMFVEESLNELINTQVKYFNKMARKHCAGPAGNALDKIGRGEEAINIVRRELGWFPRRPGRCRWCRWW